MSSVEKLLKRIGELNIRDAVTAGIHGADENFLSRLARKLRTNGIVELPSGQIIRDSSRQLSIEDYVQILKPSPTVVRVEPINYISEHVSNYPDNFDLEISVVMLNIGYQDIDTTLEMLNAYRNLSRQMIRDMRSILPQVVKYRYRTGDYMPYELLNAITYAKDWLDSDEESLTDMYGSIGQIEVAIDRKIQQVYYQGQDIYAISNLEFLPTNNEGIYSF